MSKNNSSWVVDNQGRRIRRVYSPRDRQNAPANYDKIFPATAPHSIAWYDDRGKKI